jgi:hypothetical protein
MIYVLPNKFYNLVLHMFICHLSSSIKFYWTLIFSLATKMKRCLSFYFVYHEDELGSSFAFIYAQIAKGYWE